MSYSDIERKDIIYTIENMLPSLDKQIAIDIRENFDFDRLAKLVSQSKWSEHFQTLLSPYTYRILRGCAKYKQILSSIFDIDTQNFICTPYQQGFMETENYGNIALSQFHDVDSLKIADNDQFRTDVFIRTEPDNELEKIIRGICFSTSACTGQSFNNIRVFVDGTIIECPKGVYICYDTAIGAVFIKH